MITAARVVQGHGVASGKIGDPRYPDGTIAPQLPYFSERGLDTSGLHHGTINLDISPASYTFLEPKLTIPNLRWHPDARPETFSFFDCRLILSDEMAPISGLIYYPHPETKMEHFQPPNVLEVLAPEIAGIHYGQLLKLETDPHQIAID